jgi:hypothetical protein
MRSSLPSVTERKRETDSLRNVLRLAQLRVKRKRLRCMQGIAVLIFGMVQCLVTPNCGGPPHSRFLC